MALKLYAVNPLYGILARCGNGEGMPKVEKQRGTGSFTTSLLVVAFPSVACSAQYSSRSEISNLDIMQHCCLRLII